jgi:hypothetical protein
VEPCTLQLIGIAAIILAVKMNENKTFPFELGAQECNNIYTPEMIEITERTMLAMLKFKMDIPTVIDFLQFFLFLTIKEDHYNDIQMLI